MMTHMKRIFFLAFMAVLVTGACQQEGNDFGAAFTAEASISVDELYAELVNNEKVENIIVEGTVDEVCQVKGCWMTLVAGDGTSMRVSFLDYGFFVPKNISGKKVVMKGTGMVTVTSVADLQHYAEDAGDSEEEIAAITEPLEEFTFIADGVQLLD
jgi:hypothetical protein